MEVSVLKSFIDEGRKPFNCYFIAENVESLIRAVQRCVTIDPDNPRIMQLPNGFTFRETYPFVFSVRRGKLVVHDFEKTLLFDEELYIEYTTRQENSVPVESSENDEFINELTCSICLGQMVDPHVNSAGEMYCRECLIELFDHDIFVDPRTRAPISSIILPCNPANRILRRLNPTR
jgi:hypothetical protein